MKNSLFEKPHPSDLIGLPSGKYFIHDFPSDIQAADNIRLVLNDVKKKLINFSGDRIEPDKATKQPNKLTRHTEIELIFPQKIKPISLFLNINSQIIFVLGKRDTALIIRPEILKPKEASITTYYKRNKKNKVLNACFFVNEHPVADIHLALCGFEIVLAVDTNCRDIKDVGKISATTAIEASFNKVTDDAFHMQLCNKLQKITIDPPDKPEIFGIGIMMYHLLETNPDFSNKKVGIITDTELGLLKGINQRTVPFYKDMMLPEKTTLFYATRDSGSAEFIANKLVRICDNESTKYLDRYIDNNFL
jgi:hypothetical protein